MSRSSCTPSSSVSSMQPSPSLSYSDASTSGHWSRLSTTSSPSVSSRQPSLSVSHPKAFSFGQMSSAFGTESPSPSNQSKPSRSTPWTARANPVLEPSKPTPSDKLPGATNRARTSTSIQSISASSVWSMRSPSVVSLVDGKCVVLSKSVPL